MQSLTLGVVKDIVLTDLEGAAARRAWDGWLTRSANFQRKWFADWPIFKGKCKNGGPKAILKKPKDAAARPEVSRSSKYDLCSSELMGGHARHWVEQSNGDLVRAAAACCTLKPKYVISEGAVHTQTAHFAACIQRENAYKDYEGGEFIFQAITTFRYVYMKRNAAGGRRPAHASCGPPTGWRSNPVSAAGDLRGPE